MPNITAIKAEEEKCENDLIERLEEEHLSYLGSIVLGLNDALVELTGAIAGLTLAISDTKLISLSALITGIAASLSMASSQYLSVKTQGGKNAKKSAIYTGITYIVTVMIMVMPYLFIKKNKFLSLGIMLSSVVLIIFIFNYYISVTKSQPFKARFFQMISISLGVAAISFCIGYFIKIVLVIDI